MNRLHPFLVRPCRIVFALALALALPLAAVAQTAPGELPDARPESTTKFPPLGSPEITVDLDLGPAHTPPVESELELTRRELLRTLATAEGVAAGVPATSWSFERGPNAPAGASLVAKLTLDWSCGLPASAPLTVRVPWHSELGSLVPASGEVVLVAGEKQGGYLVAHDAVLWNGSRVRLGAFDVPLTPDDLATLCSSVR